MKRRFITVIMLLIAALLLYGCAERKDLPKDILQVETSKPEPNYAYQLWLSDEVVFGEVMEEYEGRYANPNGELNGVTNSWVTPYLIRVEKAYKGLFKEGESVMVYTWNDFGPREKEEYIVMSDSEEFFLSKGQRGVFMLSRSVLSTEEQAAYYVVYEKEGIFELKDGAEGVYASPHFETTLDRLPEDIARAEEQYGAN